MAGLADQGVVRRRVYLVRHGEVSYFDTEGRPVDPRRVTLTETGERQARALGEMLSAIPIDQAVTSGVPRTRQTAEIILAGRQVAIEDEPDLREIRGGRFAEVPSEEAIRAIAYAFDAAAAPGATFYGGEAFDGFARRVLAAFDRIVDRPGWTRTLIVGHDGVNRVILAWAARTDRRAMAALEQDSGALNILDIDLDRETGAIVRRFVRALNLTPLDPAKAERWETSMEPIYRLYAEARRKGHV